MKYLIDTHVFIWILNKNKNAEPFKKILNSNPDNIYISIESLREIAIKNRIGKLELKERFENIVKNVTDVYNINLLNIEKKHLVTLNKLTCPKWHGDPFDHMIISQAIAEKMTLLSKDGKFKEYIDQGLKFIAP